MTDRPRQVGIMKATPLEERFVASLGPTCFAQRKFRGQHARVAWIDTEPVLVSSYGNAFCFLDHILADLRRLPRLPYVGELYVHTLSQQEINSILNRTTNPHPDTLSVTFHIFDIAAPAEQYARFMQLDQLFALTHLNKIHWASYRVINPFDWPVHCARYLAEGYEGIILRSLSNVYRPVEPDGLVQRPRDILKYKPRESDTYRIIGCKPGTGWAKGMLGSFIVEDESGVRFSVGTGRELTKRKRQEWWAVREELTSGAYDLVVKHEPITTADGIPICTSAYEVRKRC
jgi:hypothetical protein